MNDVVTRLKATPHVKEVKSPYARGNEGQLSADGTSALVTFKLQGEDDLAKDRVDATLDATAAAQRAHPDLRACVARVDVMRHGHAMPRPEPGFLAAHRPWWHPPRDARVLWANTDVSGLSLFEEAQYRGVQAAERAMALVGRGG